MSSWISVSSSNTIWHTFVSLFVLASESDDPKVVVTFFCSARGTSFDNAATSIVDDYWDNLQNHITNTQQVNTNMFPTLWHINDTGDLEVHRLSVSADYLASIIGLSIIGEPLVIYVQSAFHDI